MKRYTLLLTMGLVIVSSLSAQSFSEWFKQKKTQKKYLLAQIAALETYRQAIAKGYSIAKSGLSLAAQLKDGDFLQHRLYFSSMEMVSTRVKSYSRVLAIAALEDKAGSLLQRLMVAKELDKALNTGEIEALLQFKSATVSQQRKDLETLQLLVSNGSVKMTDDERISNIDRLYNEVRKKFSQVLHFTRDVQALIGSRRKSTADANTLKRLSLPGK